jgi:hypothetical protein
MSYKIGFDGVVSAELEKLLQSVENRLNGLGMYVQTSDAGASTATSGSTTSPCPSGQTCSDSGTGGHDAIVVVIAIVGGAVAGYVAGKQVARSILSKKGGQV